MRIGDDGIIKKTIYLINIDGICGARDGIWKTGR